MHQDLQKEQTLEREQVIKEQVAARKAPSDNKNNSELTAQLQSLQDNINESNKQINQKIADAKVHIAEKTFEPKNLAATKDDNRMFDDTEIYQDDAFLEPVNDFGIPDEFHVLSPDNNQTHNIPTQDTKSNDEQVTNNSTPNHNDVINSQSVSDNSEQMNVEQINAVQIQNTTADIKVADNPLALLQCPKAEMTGEWDFEKWEYWIRQAELIPAVLNLAHKGVMTGIIGQESVFLIPKSKAMEQVADEFFDRLVDRLKQDWPDIQVSYQLMDNTMNTPEQQMVVRKEQALAAAKVKIAQEPLAQELLETYGGELYGVKLTI